MSVIDIFRKSKNKNKAIQSIQFKAIQSIQGNSKQKAYNSKHTIQSIQFKAYNSKHTIHSRHTIQDNSMG